MAPDGTNREDDSRRGTVRTPTVRWRLSDGSPVACTEKIKVLNDNLAEFEQVCRDAFEDALLMGCDEQQVRDVFATIVQSLSNPYRRD